MASHDSTDSDGHGEGNDFSQFEIVDEVIEEFVDIVYQETKWHDESYDAGSDGRAKLLNRRSHDIYDPHRGTDERSPHSTRVNYWRSDFSNERTAHRDERARMDHFPQKGPKRHRSRSYEGQRYNRSDKRAAPRHNDKKNVGSQWNIERGNPSNFGNPFCHTSRPNQPHSGNIDCRRTNLQYDHQWDRKMDNHPIMDNRQTMNNQKVDDNPVINDREPTRHVENRPVINDREPTRQVS